MGHNSTLVGAEANHPRNTLTLGGFFCGLCDVVEILPIEHSEDVSMPGQRLCIWLPIGTSGSRTASCRAHATLKSQVVYSGGSFKRPLNHFLAKCGLMEK